MIRVLLFLNFASALFYYKETYCDMLAKYKSDLARPFDEATTFLNKVELQLRNLCTTTASVRSLSGQSLSLFPPLSLPLSQFSSLVVVCFKGTSLFFPKLKTH